MRILFLLVGLALPGCAAPQETDVFIPIVPDGTIRAVCDERAAAQATPTEQEEMIAAWHCGDGENFVALYGRPDVRRQRAVLAKAERAGRDSLHLEEVQVLDYACHEQALETNYC